MKLRVAMLAFAGILAAGLLPWAASVRADDTPTAKIAVCDPTKVLNQIQEGKDVVQKWRTDGSDLQAQAKAKKDALDAKAEEIKLLMPTSPEYQKKVDDMTLAQADFQAWFQGHQMNLAREQRTQEKDLFDKILKGVNEVAAAKGITLVMNCAHPEFPDLDHMDANAFFQVVLMHTTLFNDAKLDITQDVIIALDKEYTAPH